jgi:hypothetical protein
LCKAISPAIVIGHGLFGSLVFPLQETVTNKSDQRNFYSIDMNNIYSSQRTYHCPAKLLMSADDAAIPGLPRAIQCTKHYTRPATRYVQKYVQKSKIQIRAATKLINQHAEAETMPKLSLQWVIQIERMYSKKEKRIIYPTVFDNPSIQLAVLIQVC